MYAAIAIRPNCLLSHSKFLSSSIFFMLIKHSNFKNSSFVVWNFTFYKAYYSIIFSKNSYNKLDLISGEGPV